MKDKNQTTTIRLDPDINAYLMEKGYTISALARRLLEKYAIKEGYRKNIKVIR